PDAAAAAASAPKCSLDLFPAGDPRQQAVREVVETAGQRGPRALARRVDVAPVDPNRRRTRKAKLLRLLAGEDLAHFDLGVDPSLPEHLVEQGAGFGIRRAAFPEEQLDLHYRALP